MSTPPKLKRAYADAPTGQVHYYDSLGDGAPLLMVHQAPASSLDYAPAFADLIAAGIRVIAMDMPGFGMSDAPDSAPVIADYAAAVPCVLDHAGVTQAGALGYHTGAQVVTAAAAAWPDRIGKLILYGAPLMTEAELKSYWDAIVPGEKDGALHKPAPGGAYLTDQFAKIEAIMGPVAAHRILLASLNAGPLWWYGHNAALTHDMTANLRAAPQPVMLLTHPGEMLDKNTRAAQSVRPDATLVALDIDSPYAVDGDPAAFAQAVAGFMRG